MSPKKTAPPDPGKLITGRPGGEAAALYQKVHGIVGGLYGIEAKERYALKGAFLLRLLAGLVNIGNAWFALSMLSGEFREGVIESRLRDFDAETASLESALADAFRSAIALDQGKPAQEDAIAALHDIEGAALAIGATTVNWRASYKLSADQPLVQLVNLEALAASDYLHQGFARILAMATSLRIALEHIQHGPPKRKTKASTEAERARRYRARRRRRVAFQATIDVYDEDIALLRQFGFVSAPEREDVDLVTKQLEVFLLNAFLTYPYAATPWGERPLLQHGRITALSNL